MIGDLRTLHVDEHTATRRAMLEEIERTRPELLTPEFRTLRKHFKSLRAEHPGDYVAIFGDTVLGVWKSFDEADRTVYQSHPHQTVTIVRLDEHADLPAAVAVNCLGEIFRRGEEA